ncbi:hypothetical protein BC828DRAFT_405475 [Blastocladiella britannica]|nr:hypothetical protein BC828DRAFT_405475 [Blastocladiella britannica]
MLHIHTLLTPQGSNPLQGWSIETPLASDVGLKKKGEIKQKQSPLVRLYERGLKGFCYEAGATTVKMSHTHTTVNGQHPYLVLQLLVTSGSKKLAIDLNLVDRIGKIKSKRRVYLTTAAKEGKTTPLHVVLPIGPSVPVDQWFNLVIDMAEVLRNAYLGSEFCQLSSLQLLGDHFRIRNAFTIGEAYFDPDMNVFNSGIPNSTSLPFTLTCTSVLIPSGGDHHPPPASLMLRNSTRDYHPFQRGDSALSSSSLAMSRSTTRSKAMSTASSTPSLSRVPLLPPIKLPPPPPPSTGRGSSSSRTAIVAPRTVVGQQKAGNTAAPTAASGSAHNRNRVPPRQQSQSSRPTVAISLTPHLSSGAVAVDPYDFEVAQILKTKLAATAAAVGPAELKHSSSARQMSSRGPQPPPPGPLPMPSPKANYARTMTPPSLRVTPNIAAATAATHPPPRVASPDDDDEAEMDSVELIYDPASQKYMDPSTGKYYEIE